MTDLVLAINYAWLKLTHYVQYGWNSKSMYVDHWRMSHKASFQTRVRCNMDNLSLMAIGSYLSLPLENKRSDSERIVRIANSHIIDWFFSHWATTKSYCGVRTVVTSDDRCGIAEENCWPSSSFNLRQSGMHISVGGPFPRACIIANVVSPSVHSIDRSSWRQRRRCNFYVRRCPLLKVTYVRLLFCCLLEAAPPPAS